MSDKLKPCPVCKGTLAEVKIPPLRHIQCIHCLSIFPNEQRANTRPIEDELHQQLAEKDAEIAELKQSKLEYCDVCGWDTKHPEGCINCENSELKQQNAELVEAIKPFIKLAKSVGLRCPDQNTTYNVHQKWIDRAEQVLAKARG